MERMEMARLDSSLNKNAPFSAYNKFSWILFMLSQNYLAYLSMECQTRIVLLLKSMAEIGYRVGQVGVVSASFAPPHAK